MLINIDGIIIDNDFQSVQCLPIKHFLSEPSNYTINKLNFVLFNNNKQSD